MGPRGQRNKKSSAPSTTSNGDSDSNNMDCPVCFNSGRYYSVGICNHSICQECSVRMRVLLKANECPICRQELTEVYHSISLVPYPKSSNLSEFLDKKHGIRFENQIIRDHFKSLNRHICPICKEGKPTEFASFEQLETHCRREHELFYCQLCYEHLKLFTHERRLYSRSQLAVHRRKGDSDDKSHKGHPNCKFCDIRFMDNEALFLHLRKEHYFCHFCDSNGQHNDYYPNYDALREHFGEEHYLCTEGSCIDQQFTHAFKTEIDLKAHRVEVHGNAFSKHDARMNRTVGLDLNYKNRRSGNNKSRGGRNNNHSSRENVPPVFDEPIQRQQILPDVNSAENFPSLGSGGATGISHSNSGDELAKKLALKSGKSFQKWNSNQPSGMRREEDFPSLGGPSVVSSSSAIPKNQKGKNVAQRIRDSEFANNGVVNASRSNLAWGNEVQTVKSNNNKGKVSKPPAEDFPGLGPPSRKKNINDTRKGTKKNGAEDGPMSNLQSAANVISAASNNWSVVSSKQSSASKKSSNQKPNASGSIPGLNYSSETNRCGFLDGNAQNSIDTLVNDFPSLGPSSQKISAHFQPNTRDPIPNQWDNVSSPELFLPSEVSGGAKPKTAPPPRQAPKPQKFTKTPNSSTAPSIYNPPNDFAARNKKLLSLIMRILGGKSLEFKEFMTISKKFRDESITSEEFYDKCVEIVGSNNKLMEFLPELIFLLPEIRKQQELHKIHQRKNSFLKIVNLQECDKCRQILSSEDFPEHKITHNLDGDFPSLYAS